MSAAEQRKLLHGELSYDERITLKQLIDEKTRTVKNITAKEIRKYSYPDYVKKWELERRIKNLAQEGLTILRDNEDYVLCMHCHKRSSKLTRKDKRHEPNCPRTPLTIVGYTND